MQDGQWGEGHDIEWMGWNMVDCPGNNPSIAHEVARWVGDQTQPWLISDRHMGPVFGESRAVNR